ncbi:MAG: carboxylating nicotinate-nucleotide diphosphorylase [Candidatus Krumholzibacteriia bacterium]
MDARDVLHDPWLATLLDQALAEDIGGGDASTAITVAAEARARARVTAREAGVVAGLVLLAPLAARLDGAIAVELLARDGEAVAAGRTVAVLAGPAGPLLTLERTALNLLQQLSGIASLTARYVAEVAGTACQVLDTRKTVPGWRRLAKYAVRCGGGINHRFGLYDRIMLKDNHWAAGGERIDELVARGRARYPDLAIEVEVDTLAQLDRVLPLRVEWILLDNFSPAAAVEAVRRRDAADVGTLLEASGNVTLATIGEYARAGVDAASVGRLTHSAPALDLGIDMELLP